MKMKVQISINIKQAQAAIQNQYNPYNPLKGRSENPVSAAWRTGQVAKIQSPDMCRGICMAGQTGDMYWGVSVIGRANT